jgi:hypothetical protein
MPDFGSFRAFGDKLVQGQTPTQLGLIGSFTNIDPDAQAFFDRVSTNGGTLSATEQLAINTLVFDMKTAGIWTAQKFIYPMVGGSSAACAVNLKSASFTGTFNGGWTFSSSGVTPNGVTGYFDTTFVPSANFSTASSAHLSYYLGTFAEAARWQIGCRGANDQDLFISAKYNSAQSWIPINSGTGIYTDTNAIRGFIQGNRTDAVTRKTFKNGVLFNTASVNSTFLPNTSSIYLGAINLSGIFGADNARCQFATVGEGLTDTQSADFYTAVQAFQTTLGRQV